MVILLTNPKKYEGAKILKKNMHTKCLIIECKKGCLIVSREVINVVQREVIKTGKNHSQNQLFIVRFKKIGIFFAVSKNIFSFVTKAKPSTKAQPSIKNCQLRNILILMMNEDIKKNKNI